MPSSISLMSSPSPLSSDLPNDLTTDNSSRVCSSGSCHTVVSPNSIYKMCERCREKSRIASRKRTIRKAKERASIEAALDAEAENRDTKEKKILKAKSKALKSASSGGRHKLTTVDLSVSSSSAKGKRKAIALVDSDDDDEDDASRATEPLAKRFKRFMQAVKRYDVAADTHVKPTPHKLAYTRFCTSADLLSSLKLALTTPSPPPSGNTLFKGTYSVVASPSVSHAKLAKSFLNEFKGSGAMVFERAISRSATEKLVKMIYPYNPKILSPSVSVTPPKQTIKRTQSNLSNWVVKKDPHPTTASASSSKANATSGTVTITIELDESHALGIVGQMVSVHVQG